MEQLVARRAHNPKVVGSSPAPATMRAFFRALFYWLKRRGLRNPGYDWPKKLKFGLC